MPGRTAIAGVERRRVPPRSTLEEQGNDKVSLLALMTGLLMVAAFTEGVIEAVLPD